MGKRVWYANDTFVRLASDEHIYRAYTRFDQVISEVYAIDSTTYVIRAKSEADAKRTTRRTAKQDYPQAAIVSLDVEQDDGMICKHCGLLGGH